MSTVQDNISNLSYTSKDFESIYPELLDLVKKLTDKWDPTTSNESDPGVVLIKLMALIGDKNNYNIDKNILETFPSSVTQFGNARKLYNELGYNLKWYQSATVSTTFSVNLKTLIGNDTENSSKSVTIPKYTMFTTEDENIVYTLVDKDVPLTVESPSATGVCMQGVIQDYIINGSDLITLDNLDENRRLYFTETQVAENGIFIVSGDWSNNNDNLNLWETTNNLAIEPSGKKVFQFGVLPNNNTCYIQFPVDVALLMQNGLKIKYLISNGESGNIKASILTKFYANTDLHVRGGSSEDETLKTDDIIIRNASSSIGGANPESLNSAYNNYKHTIGTFNTLVSCRDYENYIYNLKNDYGNYYVSNVKVTDRVNDLNSSQLVVTLDNTGKVVKTLEDKGMDAFNIRLYLLNNPPQITNDVDFNLSFQQADTPLENNVKEALEDTKSIQHDYTDFTDGDYFMVQNICNLTGNLVTYYKVTSSEAVEIEKKVKQALRESYNPRNLEWGKELNYDSILQTIQNADKRIKSVVLNEPTYIPYLIRYNEGGSKTSVDLSNNDSTANEEKLKILASMIRSGNVPYFKFDTDFQYALGQVSKGISYNGNQWNEDGGEVEESKSVINSIKSIETNLTITSKDKKIDYTIRSNENIYLTSPKLVTNTIYSSGVNYRLTGNNLPEDKIPKNSYYTLQDNQTLTLYYTDSNNTRQRQQLYSTDTQSITIQPVNFDLLTTLPSGDDKIKDEDNNEIAYYTLTGSQSINICDINSQKLENGIYCFWITNRVNVDTHDSSKLKYTLLGSGEDYYILKNNEYFIYTDNSKSELYILGSGTRISRFGTPNISEEVSITLPNTLLPKDIVNEGLKSINDNIWIPYNSQNEITGGYPLTLTEMNIITLGEKAVLKGSISTNDLSGNPSTKALNLLSNVEYKVDSSSTGWKSLADLSKILDINKEPANWSMLPVLNINSSPTTPQFVDSNQKITITYNQNNQEPTSDVVPGQYFLLNAPIALAGPDMDLTVTEINSYNGESNITNPISAYIYYNTKTNNSLSDGTITPDLTPVLGINDVIVIGKDKDGNFPNLDNYNFSFNKNTTYLMYVVNNLTTDGASFTINGADKFEFTKYAATSTKNKSVTIQRDNSERVNFIYIRFEDDNPNFKLFNNEGSVDWATGKDRILISPLYVLPTNSINEEGKYSSNYYNVSDQIMETFGSEAINKPAKSPDSTAITTILNDLWDKLSITNENDPNGPKLPNYDILYNVKGIDSIDTELYGQNQGLFAAAALWDPNHVLNPYTLPMLNTSETPLKSGDPSSKYNIKVAYSSRTS